MIVASDPTTNSSVSIIVGSETEEALNEWLNQNTINLIVEANNYDSHLLDLEQQSAFTESTDSDLDTSLDTDPDLGIVISIESVDIDDSYNKFGVQFAATKGNLAKDFEYDTTVKLPKKHHYGEICWEFATPTPEESNTVQYRWYRKWRTWFRKWTFTRAGNLNQAGDCDEFYYSGNRIKVRVGSNYRNFSVYEKKNSGDSWNEIY